MEFYGTDSNELDSIPQLAQNKIIEPTSCKVSVYTHAVFTDNYSPP